MTKLDEILGNKNITKFHDSKGEIWCSLKDIYRFLEKRNPKKLVRENRFEIEYKKRFVDLKFDRILLKRPNVFPTTVFVNVLGINKIIEQNNRENQKNEIIYPRNNTNVNVKKGYIVTTE